VSCLTREVNVVNRLRRPVANRPSWTQVLVLSLFVIVPAAIVALSGYSAARGDHPTDEELTARFLSHEADFQALIHMLDSDRRRLLLADGPLNLAELEAAGATRAGDYRVLLAKFDATNVRYFPRSGNVVVLVAQSGEHFADTKKSYLYLSREPPQPLLHHSSYAWRGPGIYFVTGDQRIKGQWFIHHDGTVVVAFAPY
jgi:hypothetical protein